MDNHFDKPEGLDADGTRAWEAIMGVLREADKEIPLSTGGCTAFYSPKAWRDRGEKYGRNSVLVVVYDGGDMSLYFRMGEFGYSCIEKMNEALKKEGFFAEECTGWYAAIYKI